LAIGFGLAVLSVNLPARRASHVRPEMARELEKVILA